MVVLPILLLAGTAAENKSYAFNRKFVVGDVDGYAVSYRDNAHTNSPYMATVVMKVTTVNTGGGGVLSVVGENATKNNNGQTVLDSSGDFSGSWTENALGVPGVPAFPDLGYLGAIALGMQGFRNNAVMGLTVTMPPITSGTGATVTLQSTLVSLTPPVFHVTGTETLPNVNPAGGLNCTYTLDAATSKVTLVNFVVTMGHYTASGTFTRNSS